MRDVRELFVDTNVLIYATNELSVWYPSATKSLQTARQLGIDLILSPQILREYLAAATRLSISGSGLSVPKILENFHTFQAEFRLVEDNRLVLKTLGDLLEKISVSGKQIHDANLVATMLTHGIRHLLTHNTGDFTRFSAFITVLPLEVIENEP
ncbi:MAG: hypothetical protein A3F84_23555 [Candidatus Handelsmanbacteria bacterium RIFCSPLOWO2_12_FULL_64_10]|uniref:PIN domain-containing protein n=1 Tax=Handelsmanbacteria sp. (strain RIFCSPLOWO2_12_FULL_64_10) TaxID=1817868 RepID=A0A1F6CRL8_HANXR|nr:MAG: hypothetical protein A3F84_23555 [Candidatus Handelsmanbacteria bacterium RIFCSPLOWO2_12_FULL_64_10]